LAIEGGFIIPFLVKKTFNNNKLNSLGYNKISTVQSLSIFNTFACTNYYTLAINDFNFVSVMREWSLFALRNILEGNLDNQDFVANIDSVGSLDPESSVTLTDTLKMASIKNSISDSDTMFI